MVCFAKHAIISSKMTSLRYTMQFFLLTSYTVVKYGAKISIHLTKKVFNLQNRALHIISFADFRARSNPLYINFKILKLSHQIFLQNCLFVHDTLKKVSPLCFHNYFSQAKHIHSLATKSANLGCLHVLPSNTVRYGLNSVISKCISDWNDTTKLLRVDLTSLSREKLKFCIKSRFIQSYS